LLQATQLQPDYSSYNSALGTAYLQLKNYPKAIEYLTKAIEYLTKAIEYLTKAIEYLTKAISNVPNSDTEYNQYIHASFNSKLGEAYWNFGKPSEAIECLTKATQYQPKSSWFKQQLIYLLQEPVKIKIAMRW